MEDFVEVTLSGAMVGCVYSLLALGFVVIYKSSHVFNFAVGQFLALGAFAFYVLYIDLGLPVIVAALIATIGGYAVGMIMERSLLRPMIGQSILASVMMTLAMFVLLNAIIVLVWGGSWYNYPPFLGAETIRLGGIILSPQYMLIAFAALALIGVFSYFFKNTKAGLGMRAVAEDHQVARTKGIDAKQVFSLSWAICGMICFVAGILLSSTLGVGIALAPLGLKAIPVVLVGGLESIPGVIIAGPLIGILEGLTAQYLSPHVGLSLEEVTPYFVLLLFLVIKPYGIFGLKRIERV